MPGYDWRTSGESAGGTSYPVSRPSHHAPSQPSGGTPNYGPPSIQNPPPQVTAPPVQTGTWSQPDPTGMGDPEKEDFIDYDYVNPNTGLTVGQTQADAYEAAQDREAERMRQMNEALAIKEKYGASLYPGQTGDKANVPWTDKDLLRAQELGLFSAEAAGMDVTGLEAETNKTKGSAINKLKRLESQASEGAWGWGTKNPKDPRNKHIEEQIRTNFINSSEFQDAVKLFGGDKDKALLNTLGLSGIQKYDFWDAKKIAKFQSNPKQTWGEVGYDPSGTKTWSDIESDPYLYESYNKLLGEDLTPDELREYLPAMGYQDRTEAWQDPNQGRYSRGYGGGQRDRNMALLQFLQGGSPIKQLEKSGFHHQGMEDPYAEPMRIAGEKGIFSGISGTGISGEAMKRLLKSWGSGYTNPRHANVAARGGIMSAWNNMRR